MGMFTNGTILPSEPVPERSTRVYRATLVDFDGNPLTPATVTSIKFSLRDDRSDAIVNGRNRVEVKGAAGGRFDGIVAGEFTQVLNTDDTIAIGGAKLQRRRALFEVTYADGIENHEVFFYVENLEDVTT